MQKIGNNIRSSGIPFEDKFDQKKFRDFFVRLDNVIKIIKKYEQQKTDYDGSVRICIDAIRNPYEAIFLKDKYRAFYLVAISTEDEERKKRLKYLNSEELINLDKIEYAQK